MQVVYCYRDGELTLPAPVHEDSLGRNDAMQTKKVQETEGAQSGPDAPVKRRVHLVAGETIQVGYFLSSFNHQVSIDLQSNFGHALSLACLDSEAKSVVLVDLSYVPAERVLDELGHVSLAEGTNIALMNVGRNQPWVSDCVLKGVRGLFYTDDDIELVHRGVSALLDGAVWISRETLLDAAMKSSRSIAPQGEHSEHELTRREREILAMICVGSTNQEIADKLFISTNTVKTHIYKIYKKIHVPNRMQAALWGAKNL